MPEPEELSVLTTIQRIKDGLLDPKMLPKVDRQPCVEVLLGEGYSEVQVAEIFKVSEKTIYRDLKDIREKNALSPDIGLAKQIIGDVYKKALLHHDRLVRLSRDQDTSDESKIQAEFLGWRVLKEMTALLQSLGYLPLKPQELVSDIYHHQDVEGKCFAELKDELVSIEKIALEAGSLDETAKERIQLIQQKIGQAEIAQEITDLNKIISKKEEKNE